MIKKKKTSFENNISIIDEELKKRRPKWSLHSITWMDYEDVCQIIRIHIYQKWEQYDETKPLEPWLNKIISNQIKNIIRNNYSNYTKPCSKCAACIGEDDCSLYENQSFECPLLSHWLKKRKSAFDVRMPLPIENHSFEIHSITDDQSNLSEKLENFHEKVKEILKPNEWKAYKLLYVDGKSEEATAKELGYKTSEKNRTPGYKQIKNVTKKIISKIKKEIQNGTIEI